jgi:N-methylhydantoinase A
VGPQSAGAEPGPAAYRRGGTEPTVTDANLVLGRINAERAIGRESGVTLDVAAAEEAIRRRVADPLGMDLHTAAAAIIEVVNNKMAGRLRLISIERGYDPREFTLIGFGGAGPLHAGALMREVGLARAIIPAYPGISSALGCIMADVRHDFVLSINRLLDELDLEALRTTIAEQVAGGEALLIEERVQLVRQVVLVEADMRYAGQRHTLRTRLPWPDLTIEGIQSAYGETYQRRYGQVLDGRLMVVNLRTTVTGERPRLRLDRLVKSTATNGAPRRPTARTRPVWFDGAVRETAEIDRADLHTGDTIAGPAIVAQGDSTTVIDPDMVARVDANGNLVVELSGGRGGA